MLKGKINEIFDSVQGEGLYLGQRQIFVRFFGCNLSCHYCDTKLVSYFEYEPEELLTEIRKYPREMDTISFTGGEPLLQVDFLKSILKITHQAGYKNYLETNGTLSGELSEVIDEVDVVAMDIKLPSSSKMGPLWGLHKKFLNTASKKEVFLKAVICADTKTDDFDEAINLIKEVDRSAVLILQPDSSEEFEVLKYKIDCVKHICENEGVLCCIIPQVHKIIGVR